MPSLSRRLSSSFCRCLLLGGMVALSACSILNKDEEKPPLPGERISVLDFERGLRPTNINASLRPYVSPTAQENSTWEQRGGNATHTPINLALSGMIPKKIWKTDIGDGSRSGLPLTAQPVTDGERIYTLDTNGSVRAFSTKDGHKLWQMDIRPEEEKDPVIGGGLALSGTSLYVTGGYDELVALETVEGKILWRTKSSLPSRAAPTVFGGYVYVSTLTNTLQAYEASRGTLLWEYSGIDEGKGLIGASSPAATEDLVLPAFSSGEIYALRANNGSLVWSDNLSSALRLGGANALSDIRGLPVVEEGIVYAVSYGGKMAAIDLLNGSRLWQKEIASSETPWIAGERIFLITAEGQIAALDKKTGALLWASQLKRFENPEKKKDPILWTGPIMAGGRLLAFSNMGRVAEVNPADGALIREWDIGESVRIVPLVAGQTLYVLTEEGTLAAYR